MREGGGMMRGRREKGLGVKEERVVTG